MKTWNTCRNYQWKPYIMRTFPVGVVYTGCPRRNVPDFGRVFLMLKYNDITQNTYVQSWTVTEIMAREKCGLLAGPRTVPLSWQPYLMLRRWVWCHMTVIQLTLAINCICTSCRVMTYQPFYVSAGTFMSCIVLGTLRTTMTWVRVFL